MRDFSEWDATARHTEELVAEARAEDIDKGQIFTPMIASNSPLVRTIQLRATREN